MVQIGELGGWGVWEIDGLLAAAVGLDVVLARWNLKFDGLGSILDEQELVEYSPSQMIPQHIWSHDYGDFDIFWPLRWMYQDTFWGDITWNILLINTK